MRRVLVGEDPLRRQIGGLAVRILDIAPQSPFGPPPSDLAKYPVGSRTARLAVYGYAEGGVSEEVARHLTRQMFDVLPVSELEITLSNSPWFIDDPEYPAQWPFLDGARFPSRKEYLAAVTIACSMRGRGTSCKRQHPE